MRIARPIVGVALVALLHGLSTSATAQAAAPERVSLTPEEMEKFLLEAKIVRSRPSGGGTTGTLRLTLSDGTVTHDASAQFVEVEQAIYRVQGYTEFNFRDCYCFNIAAYKLAVLLGIDNVPMSVDRKVTGKSAAVTWWIDDVAMDEEGRRKTIGDRSRPATVRALSVPSTRVRRAHPEPRSPPRQHALRQAVDHVDVRPLACVPSQQGPWQAGRADPRRTVAATRT